MVNSTLSRRDFLKLGGLALTSLAFTPVFPRQEERDHGLIGRVTINEIDLRSQPRDDAPIIGKRYRDQIVHIYYELIPEDAPEFYNPLWYRVWGGYLHSKWIQLVAVQHNPAVRDVPESGMLCEVTVPYTVAYQNDPWQGWHPWEGSRLYYETTHWATGVEDGPDGKPWYQLTSEIDDYLKYYVPAAHMRMISSEEIAPLAANVPPEQKRVEVSIAQQRMRAFEYDQQVYEARVSTGIPSRPLSSDSLPTATPKGRFRIYSKLPNKHMGVVTGNPDALEGDSFSLPGVPWTCFFEPNGGYAFHGTYWHNNFGLQMSHGCINMRNQDAKWLFRWTTPSFYDEITSHSDWERTGNGTAVTIE